VVESTRLQLENWNLSEDRRHALEGMIGNRFDGMTLANARELISQVIALRSEIERREREGATPKELCSFVAGHLAGREDFPRSRRRVLKRTAMLMKQAVAGELLDRRIAGVRRFEAKRETEYREGRVCARCGYRHSRTEFESGYREDGTGTWSCFGWARVKLEELQELRKIAERKQKERICLSCGGSLKDGYVEGLCWSCWQVQGGQSRENIGSVGLLVPLPSTGAAKVEHPPSKSDSAICQSCKTALATGYGLCDQCRRRMVRRGFVSISFFGYHKNW
jgi:hypothetical protein